MPMAGTKTRLGSPSAGQSGAAVTPVSAQQQAAGPRTQAARQRNCRLAAALPHLPLSSNSNTNRVAHSRPSCYPASSQLHARHQGGPASRAPAPAPAAAVGMGPDTPSHLLHPAAPQALASWVHSPRGQAPAQQQLRVCHSYRRWEWPGRAGSAQHQGCLQQQ